jgi:hypothetical protein
VYWQLLVLWAKVGKDGGMMLRIFCVRVVLFLFLLSILEALVGCASSPPVVADPLLLRPFSIRAQSEEPFAAPSVAYYSKSSKHLAFVGATHENDVSGPTHKTVQAVIEKFQPKLVILEGFETFAGPNPSFYLKASENCADANSTLCDEGTYAASLSIKMGIPFIGGEPEETEIKDEVLRKGYALSDLIYFYVLRQIPEWKRDGSFTKNNFQILAENLIRSYARRFKISLSENPSSLKTWYRSKLGKKFDFQKINTEDVAPKTDGEISILNKISQEVGTVREKHLLKLIEKSTNENGGTLVIYGSGHLVEARVALQKMFGNPINEKPF